MAKPKKSQGAAQRDGQYKFDWNHMQTFLAVIDEGSLQAAARALGQSQPTMGRHIDLLEDKLATVLFERTGRALVATDAGRQLAEIARTMQQGADNVSRSILSSDDALTGTVRISATRMIAVHLLPRIVNQIQQGSPGLDLAVVSTDEVSNLLRRDADVAIRMIKPTQSDLIAKRIGHLAILPCASRGYIDRWGMPRSLKDLFSHRMVGPDQNRTLLDGMAAFMKSIGHDPAAVQLVYRSDDFVAQAAAISAGVGVGFVEQYLLNDNPDLVALPFESPIPSMPVWLAVHREIRTTPKIRLVYDQLTTHLKGSFSA